MKIVIDTNIWLDLVVFRDSRVAALRQALELGHIRCHRTSHMMGELAEVITRPMFGLDLAAQNLAINEALQLSVHAEPPADHSNFLLCRDPDDQVFLDLSLQLPARILLSKDKALLRLASKAKRFDLEILSTWPN